MSKKLLLGLLALASAQTAAVAQNRPGHSLDRALLRQSRPVKLNLTATPDNAPGRAAASTSNRPMAPSPASWGTLIGQTTYDLQTNRAGAERIAADGNNMTSVWTQTCALGSSPNYANRGAGHNVSTDGGATWLRGTTGNCPSNFGITSQRTGWPEIAYVGGFEFLAAHTGSGVATTRRPIGGGTAAWPASTVLPFTIDTDGAGTASGTWPRMVSNGTSLHMLYCSNGSTTDPQQPSGVINPMLYSRSTDGGLTWDQQNVLLPGMDASNFESVGGDQYTIHANGNNVAVASGAFGDHLVIWKSTDNGTTFTPRVVIGDYTDADTLDIDGVPGGDSATVVAPDGAMSIVIDNNGKVHWFGGTQLIQVAKDAVTGRWVATGSYFPDAIRELWYWNDAELAGCAPKVAATIDPSVPAGAPFQTLATGNNSSRQPYNVIGPVSMPTATVDANGDVYVVYACGRLGTSDDGTSDGQYYRDLYLQRVSFTSSNQVQFYTPQNISRDLNNITDGTASVSEESVFPSVVHSVINGKIHYQWMSDFAPGNALQPATGADPEGENAIMYDAIDLSTVTWTAGNLEACVTGLAVAPDHVTFASVAPNPTTGQTTLTLDAKQAARATVTVTDVMGRQVLRLPAADLQRGINKLNLDLSNVRPGVYFYTVTTDKFTLTQRVVKN